MARLTAAGGIALAVGPFVPRVDLLGFNPMPATLLATRVLVTALYIVSAEFTKARFYKRSR